MVTFMQYFLNGIPLGGIYAIVAIGFIVIYRSTRVFNFAMGELIMLAGFVSWTILTYAHLPWWLAIVVAMVVTAGFGLFLERVAIRPLIGQGVFTLAMITIAMIPALRGLAIIIWGAFPRRFPPILGETAVSVGPFSFSPSLVFGLIAACVLVVALWWVFNRTTRGLTLSAVAEDHQVARALGISIKQSMSIAWAMAGVVAVIAAMSWLSGRSVGFLAAEIGLRAVPCALLAGFESVGGALIAGMILGISESLAVGYIDEFTAGGASMVTPFIIMLLILLVKPEGLFGWKRIERL